jgi:hypothetical protein
LALEIQDHFQVMLSGSTTFACTPETKVDGATLKELRRVEFALVD